MLDTIIDLEEEVKKLKASQLMGSSSSKLIPVYEANDNHPVSMIGWISYRFTSTGAVNPIIMPRLQVFRDGQPVSEGEATLWSDEFLVALNFEHTENEFVAPNEYSTGFAIEIQGPDWNTLHTYTVKGTIYATTEGKMEVSKIGG